MQQGREIAVLSLKILSGSILVLLEGQPHPAAHGAYYWFYAEVSLLAVLREPYEFLRIEPKSPCAKQAPSLLYYFSDLL